MKYSKQPQPATKNIGQWKEIAFKSSKSQEFICLNIDRHLRTLIIYHEITDFEKIYTRFFIMIKKNWEVSVTV